jgi:hypothetical protein
MRESEKTGRAWEPDLLMEDSLPLPKGERGSSPSSNSIEDEKTDRAWEPGLFMEDANPLPETERVLYFYSKKVIRYLWGGTCDLR